MEIDSEKLALMKETFYYTAKGDYLLGESIDLIRNKLLRYYRNKVNLIITSPPFPLNKKKKYGNLTGEAYKDWFIQFAPLFSELLTEDGSIVIEIGNSWETGKPVQSVLHLESLLGFLKHPDAGLQLCQEFICYNPSRIPSPAQWVTIDRIRTIDSYTHVWWMAKTFNPKSDNSKVLRPYSKSMKDLLKTGSYNAGERPSHHKISKNGFLKNHDGSIMPNVIELEKMHGVSDLRLPENILRFSNTSSNDDFLRACREEGLMPHPARMHPGLVAFYTDFLTEPGDLILDPFAGTNTTGYVAELMKRRWLALEVKPEYAKQALVRFKAAKITTKLNHSKY